MFYVNHEGSTAKNLRIPYYWSGNETMLLDTLDALANVFGTAVIVGSGNACSVLSHLKQMPDSVSSTPKAPTSQGINEIIFTDLVPGFSDLHQLRVDVITETLERTRSNDYQRFKIGSVSARYAAFLATRLTTDKSSNERLVSDFNKESFLYELAGATHYTRTEESLTSAQLANMQVSTSEAVLDITNKKDAGKIQHGGPIGWINLSNTPIFGENDARHILPFITSIGGVHDETVITYAVSPSWAAHTDAWFYVRHAKLAHLEDDPRALIRDYEGPFTSQRILRDSVNYR